MSSPFIIRVPFFLLFCLWKETPTKKGKRVLLRNIVSISALIIRIELSRYLLVEIKGTTGQNDLPFFDTSFVCGLGHSHLTFPDSPSAISGEL